MVDVKTLGPQRKRYLGFSTGWTAFGMALCLLVGAAFIAVPLVNAVLEVANFGTSRIDNLLTNEDVWVSIGCGGVILLIGFGLALSWAFNKSFWVADHELGLAFGHGRTAQSLVRWDTLTSMTRSQTYDVKARASRVTYTLYTHDERTFQFSGGVSGVDDLVKACQSHIEQRVGPIYEARLRQGERATFGLVALDREAVYIGPYATPWREVRGITVNTSSIVVQKRQISAEAPQSAPLDRVPNWWIFVKLARQFVGA